MSNSIQAQPAKLKLGSVVIYKNKYYVAVAYDGKMVKIMAPHRNQHKLSVLRSNVTVVPNATPMFKVAYRGSDYLVSKRGTIISLTTNRVMQWADGNGDRKAILELADLELSHYLYDLQLAEDLAREVA